MKRFVVIGVVIGLGIAWFQATAAQPEDPAHGKVMGRRVPATVDPRSPYIDPSSTSQC